MTTCSAPAARTFVRAHRPPSPVMIAYGWEFPEFVTAYPLRWPSLSSLEDDGSGPNRHREERSDAAIQRAAGPPTTL